jgi:hypothetical protein
MPTLDQAMPVYHFRERHSRWIDATPDTVWGALTSLTLNDLALTRILFTLRGLSHGDRTRSLFAAGPVKMLHATEPEYVVAGGVARPWELKPTRQDVGSLAELTAFTEPGWVKYLTDFRLQPQKGGLLLSTETRVHANDPRSRRRFALYWAVIRPGSGLIRRDMLAAVARGSAYAA